MMTPVTQMFAPLKLQSAATVWFTGSLCSYIVASLAAVSGGELINLLLLLLLLLLFLLFLSSLLLFLDKWSGLEKIIVDCMSLLLFLLL